MGFDYEKLKKKKINKNKKSISEISIEWKGQVDSPELPKTPEITEMAENFTKIGKILRQKAVRINFFVDFAFSNMLYDKKRKPANAGNQQKAF